MAKEWVKIIGSVALGAALLAGSMAQGVPDAGRPSESGASPATGQATGASEAGTAEAPADAAENAPVRVLVADDLSNLALTAPDIPVYDRYTIAERRAAGLPTALPEIAPYREGKVAYLTFDDGPDVQNTSAVLDILRDAGVHATFYVTGRQAQAHPEVLQRIYDEGHAIGNHSYDHRYEKLYPDVNGFLAEMAKTDEIIKGTAAYVPALQESGYVEHDWNVSSADAAPNHPIAQDFIDNIAGQTEGEATAHTAIILMHSSEGHEETVKALPEIIRLLQAKGYTFGVITPMTPQPW